MLLFNPLTDSMLKFFGIYPVYDHRLFSKIFKIVRQHIVRDFSHLGKDKDHPYDVSLSEYVEG